MGRDLEQYAAHFDPWAVDAAEEVHDRLAELRTGCPVARVGGDRDDDGYWLLTTYDHIAEVGRDHRRFASGVPDLGAAAEVAPGKAAVAAPVFEQDGAEHRRTRAVMAPYLSRQAAQRREPRIRQLTREVVERLRPGGGADWVADLAWRVPPLLTADLLGIAEHRQARFAELMRAASTAPGDDAAAERYARFMAEEVRARIEHPGATTCSARSPRTGTWRRPPWSSSPR
ncbi:hypothetical protein ACOBQX_08975 [Actinokineospora sp. G85]|uniref:hypothetical protein n=1 Tax=Actinokineospora sp. G85 TaxID=3406626 RepID=UPI003C751BE6